MNYLVRLKSWIKAKAASSEMQKYKMEIAILSALILLFISLFFSESVRFFGKEHPGILIVSFSVACEVICDLRAEKNLLERIKIFFGICLVAGLLLEIIEASKSDIKVEKLRASNLVLETNVGSLNSAVIQLAHEYDLSTNALAEANARLAATTHANDVTSWDTRSKHERFDSVYAMLAFRDELKGKPKWTVEILYPRDDSGGWEFANDLRTDLHGIGWTINDVRPISEDDANPEWLKAIPAVVNMGFGTNMPLSERAGAMFGQIGVVMKKFPQNPGGTNGIAWELENAISKAGLLTPWLAGVGPGFEDQRMSNGVVKIVIGQGF